MLFSRAPVHASSLLAVILGTAIAGASVPAAGAALEAGIIPQSYELLLTLEDEGFEGELKVSATATTATRELVLDASKLIVERLEASATGEPLSVTGWESEDDELRIHLSRKLLASEPILLLVDYRGEYAPRGGEGLVKTIDAERLVISTQLQPAAARRVFPGVDSPCCPSRFLLTVVAPPDTRVFSNTPVRSTVRRSDATVTSFEATEPMAPYLLAIVAGHVEATAAGMYRSIAGPPRPLRVIAPSGTLVAAGTLGSIVERLTSRFERWLGLELPTRKLDIALVPGFRYYGMENPGLLVLRSELVSWAEREQRWADLEELVAHELAHQWFGNQLSPARWRDIWISESLATWAAAEVGEPRLDTDRIIDRLRSLAGAERWSNPPLVPSYPMLERHPAAIFTSSRYRAGAHLVDDLFADTEDPARILADTIRAAGGKPQTSRELLDLLARAGVDPVRLEAFGQAIRQRRPPLLEIERRCDTDGATVALRWIRGRSPAGRVCLELHGNDPSPIIVCAPDRALEHVLTVAACPQLVVPQVATLGYANWLYSDASAYEGMVTHLEILDEAGRLSLLGSLLAAVWSRRIDAVTAADIVGREVATSSTAAGDEMRELVIRSLSDLADGASRGSNPRRRILTSLITTAAGCAPLASQLEGRESLFTALASLGNEERLCREEFELEEPTRLSSQDLRRLASRRSSFEPGAWSELLERLPTLPDDALLWLLRSPEQWPWQDREAADFLRSIAASRSRLWEHVEASGLDRFLRTAVSERYWDDVARALGSTCSDAALDLVIGTDAFVEPEVLEQRDTALIAIWSCLRVREAQDLWSREGGRR